MSNKTPMIDKVTSFTQACEEITEELTRSAGMIVTKVTPLLAPLASGLCVLFAFYDGGGKLLDGKVGNPYLVSFLVGLVLLAVVEGINFSAIFNRDRGEKLRVQYPDQLAFLKLNNLVNWCFVLTIATVGTLETLPGAVAWYVGELSAADLGFRIGLLVLPIFSRMGASIFSVSMLLDALEGTGEARRQRRLQEKREAAELEIEIENMRQQTALKLAQQQAEFAQKLEIERLKAESKLNGKRSETVQKTVKIDDLNDLNAEVDGKVDGKVDGPLAKVNASRKLERDHGKARMIEIYSAKPDASLAEVGEELGKSKTTISNWLKELEAENRVVLNGQVHVTN